MTTLARTPEAAWDANVARDARDLHRGALLQVYGYLLKLGQPLLLVLVVRAYGARAFGLYVFAQAVMLFAARVAAYGFDKALLWWVPRQLDADKRRSVRPVLKVTTWLAVGVASCVMLAAQPTVLRRFGADPEAAVVLRVMALGIVTQVWMDVLVHATLGMRQMGAQVFVKDTAVPVSFAVLALGFHLAGATHLGLALAFVLANVVGVVGAGRAFQQAFARSPWPRGEPAWPPQELVRYSGPMWVAELENALLLRIDTYAVALLTTDLALVGVYAAVVAIGNVIRQIRRAFDPLVLAIAAEIGLERNADRLSAAYSHATMLVSLTQIPMVVAVCAFADLLMPLFGHGFEAGVWPLIVICAFWLVNGAISLSAVVVSAYGASRASAWNMLVGIVVLAAACALLIPRYGLVGAAFAVGLGYTVQGVVQLVQMRTITGDWGYRRSALRPFEVGGVAAAVGAITWFATSALGVPAGWLSRSVGFGVFAIVYALGSWRSWRNARS